jgi:hypothetical protein
MKSRNFTLNNPRQENSFASAETGIGNAAATRKRLNEINHHRSSKLLANDGGLDRIITTMAPTVASLVRAGCIARDA